MVWHDHESVQQKRMKFLNAIKSVDGLSRMRRILKDWQPVLCDSRDKGDTTLKQMMLIAHEKILSVWRAESPPCQKR